MPLIYKIRLYASSQFCMTFGICDITDKKFEREIEKLTRAQFLFEDKISKCVILQSSDEQRPVLLLLLMGTQLCVSCGTHSHKTNTKSNLRMSTIGPTTSSNLPLKFNCYPNLDLSNQSTHIEIPRNTAIRLPIRNFLSRAINIRDKSLEKGKLR